jgi:hypothetical protein
MPTAKKTAKTAAPRKPVAPKKAAVPAKAVAKPARDVDAAKAEKAKKPKLVRDSFTIPKNEFTVLEGLKLRAAKLGRPVKKSEVLRAGVMALAAMGDAAFLACLTGVPAVKTGRPAKT